MPEKLSEVLMETIDSQLDDDAVEKLKIRRRKRYQMDRRGKVAK